MTNPTHSIKCCDLSANLAAQLFALLNPREVALQWSGFVGGVDEIREIVVDAGPDGLVYPEGWYFAKGRFTNKHNSSTGQYSAIPMKRGSSAQLALFTSSRPRTSSAGALLLYGDEFRQ